MINCAHPTHFAGALADGGPWRERHPRPARQRLERSATRSSTRPTISTTAIRPTSRERHVALRGTLPGLAILGGCCGTDIRHVTSICDAWLGA